MLVRSGLYIEQRERQSTLRTGRQATELRKPRNHSNACFRMLSLRNNIVVCGVGRATSVVSVAV